MSENFIFNPVNSKGFPTVLLVNYSSDHDTPSVTAKVPFAITSQTPARAEWRMDFQGKVYTGEGMNAEAEWDTRNGLGFRVAPGPYYFNATETFYYDSGARPSLTVSATVEVHRGDIWPFGFNWMSSYDTLLVDRGPDVALIQADGQHLRYTRRAEGGFRSPPGDYSVLERFLDGSWKRTMPNGLLEFFNSLGRLTRIEDRNGNAQTLAYEPNGIALAAGQWGLTTRLKTITDPSGRTTTLNYGPTGYVSQVTDPVGRQYSLAHDAAGNLISITDPLGRVTRYEYDANHLLTRYVYPKGSATTLAYDSRRRMTTHTDALGKSRTAAYGDGQNTFTDERGIATIYSTGPSGAITRIVNPVQTVNFSYNERRQLAAIDQPPQQFTYDNRGNLASYTSFARNSATYDTKFNQQLTSTDPAGYTSQYAYDAKGNLTSITDPLGRQVRFEYDSVGQLTRVIDPLNRATNLTYDNFGNVVSRTDPLGFSSTYQYDSRGNLTRITDEEGRARNFTFDNADRMTGASNALGQTTQYAYDSQDNLTRFTDGRGNAVTYAYDALDRLTQRTDPLGRQTKYAYDGAGNLTSQTDAKGGVKSFVYDGGGRLIRTQITGGETISYSYDAIGQLTGMAGPTGNISYTYSTGVTGKPDAVQTTIAGLPALTSRVSYEYVSVGGGNAVAAQAQSAALFTPPPPSAEGWPGASTPVRDTQPTAGDNPLQHAAGDAGPEAAGLAPYSEQPTAIGTNVCGTLTSNTAWTTAGNPYILTCDVAVNPGVTLAIDPGVVVKFQDYYTDLWVYGTLIADGTPQARITFTSLKDDSVGGDSNGDGSATAPAPNDWSSIRFGNGSVGSVVDNATIRYCGGDWYECVYIQTTGISFTNNTVTRSGETGMRLDNVLPAALTGNSFTNNTNSAVYANLNANTNSITLSGNSASGNQLNGFVVEGTIGGNVTWDGDDNFPFILWNDLVVNEGASLTLTPGSIVKFHDYYDDIWVYGKLVADGTPQSPITFTSVKDDSLGGDSTSDGSATTPGPNDWSSVRFGNSSVGSVVDNAIFRYCGGDWYECVYIQTRNITFTNNTITRSGETGLRLDNALPAALTGNSFISNTNSAIYANLGANTHSIALSGNSAGGNQFNGFVTEGTIGGSVTWDGDDNFPFIIWQDLAVNAGGSLTLTPGSIVKFNDYYDDIWIYGSLVADGTPGQPIFFTSLNDHSVGGATGSGTPQPNDWSSIRLMAGGSATFDNAQMRYAGGDWYETLYVNSANLTLTDSAIVNSGERGVTIDAVSPTLTGNLIRGNQFGVYTANSANPILHNNQISGNSQYGFLKAGGGPVINAEENWWGSGSGPLDTSDDRAAGGLFNPAGAGDRVSDGVDYDPWLQLSGLLYGYSVATGSNPIQSVAYRYDPLSRLSRISAGGPAAFSVGHFYDAAGQLVGLGPLDGSPGVSATLQYDGGGRLTRLVNRSANGATVLADLRYTYDKVGNLLSAQDGAGTTNYSYDALHQLVSVSGPGLNESYSYDAAGNRTAKGGVTYSYNAANQLTGASDGSSYSYDANGNRTGKTVGGQTTSYTWDGNNRLTRINFPDGSHAAYTYDADGKRLSKRDRSGQMSYYIYEGLNLVQELNSAGAVVASYVYDRLDQPLSMTRGGVTYYYLYDQLGNVIGLSNGAAGLVVTYRYDPWGNVIAAGGSNPNLPNPFRFTGREWDAESGLYFYRARYYDPQVGRFLSPDPLHVLAGRLQAYVYANNNPLAYSDPLGLDTFDRRWWQSVGGFGVGIGVGVFFGAAALTAAPLTAVALFGGGLLAGGAAGGATAVASEAIFAGPCDKSYSAAFGAGFKGGFAGGGVGAYGGYFFAPEIGAGIKVISSLGRAGGAAGTVAEQRLSLELQIGAMRRMMNQAITKQDWVRYEFYFDKIAALEKALGKLPIW